LLLTPFVCLSHKQQLGGEPPSFLHSASFIKPCKANPLSSLTRNVILKCVPDASSLENVPMRAKHVLHLIISSYRKISRIRSSRHYRMRRFTAWNSCSALKWIKCRTDTSSSTLRPVQSLFLGHSLAWSPLKRLHECRTCSKTRKVQLYWAGKWMNPQNTLPRPSSRMSSWMIR